jgi:hypothetical protein
MGLNTGWGLAELLDTPLDELVQYADEIAQLREK